ncbi:hypothetical protein BJX70DRAFT_397596 [Aspergillus crustosus]
MKLILAGATGYIGQELLTTCLAHNSITSIVALSRRNLGITNPKLRVHLMKDEDYLSYSDPALLEELKGASACIWALGLRPSQARNDERTKQISVDYPQKAVEAFQTIFDARSDGEEKKRFRFVYISGAGVERDQNNKSLWFLGDFRRLRGEAENVLLRHAESHPDSFETYILRPALVPSSRGTLKDRVWRLFPSVGLDSLVKVAIYIAIDGHRETTIENQDLIDLGRRLAAGCKICVVEVQSLRLNAVTTDTCLRGHPVPRPGVYSIFILSVCLVLVHSIHLPNRVSLMDSSVIMVDIEALDERYRGLCVIDDNKDRLIADLFSHVNQLHRQLQDQRNELDDQKRLTNSFREENEHHKIDLANSRRDQDKLSYVSVLVDGEGMNFEKRFIENGKDGGHEAARALIQAVDHHIRQVAADVPPSTVFRIRVYANLDGLGKAYRDAGFILHYRSIDMFVHGFNQADENCDFVDVGGGKECSDVKLKAMLKQDMLDVHCRRVVFCASADNGYAHVLRPHQHSNRISLVEGPPFAFEMKQLADKFETTQFKTVFLSTKLKPDSASLAATIKPLTPPATPLPNYAAAARVILAAPSPEATVRSTRRPGSRGLKQRQNQRSEAPETV